MGHMYGCCKAMNKSFKMFLVTGETVNEQFLFNGAKVINRSVLREVSLTANQCLSTLEPETQSTLFATA